MAPLEPSGRWLTDTLGRVVILHGFNYVAKSPPFYPAAFGFGDDDAAFLAAEGFTVPARRRRPRADADAGA